ncbi:MAG: ABC transporter ATP-binding protein [Bulleidia sp.]|nr:ABC transporter ATP-binding protein [Bulleidia sp.]
MKTMIEFKDFSFQYKSQKKPTLHHINLEIKEGEKVLIVGPSGSGKSTLGHCINGLIPFAYPGKKEGKLFIEENDSEKLDIFSSSKLVGTVMQDADSQFVGLNVGEDIAFSLENNAVETDKMHEIVKKVANLVGMGEFLEQSPLELSGGQKQDVCMAGVMVDEAPILLFDEPLANLDPATGKLVIELIDEINKTQNKTIIIIEHRLEDVLHRPVDRIVLVNNGEILADCKPEELFATTLLEDNGIRLPLYVQAMKYADVDLSKVKNLADDTDYDLQDQKDKLVHWYNTNKTDVKKKESEPLLTIKDLCFSYDGVKPILDHVSLDVHQGEMISVVGKNGAGKSTLCKCICAFEKADAGTLTFENTDMNDLSVKERADRIGFVLQNPNQMICNTMIFDEAAMGLRNRGISEDKIKEKVENTLKICGLYPFRNWPISALSYGQKKRVTIASILALEPKMIILDEPTAGQDYRRYSEIMEFLKSLNEMGIAIVMITHDMHLMLEYTTRSVVLTGGKKIADATPSEVLGNEALIERANLKKTSLSTLASKAGIEDRIAFIDTFIQHERGHQI